MKISIDTKEDSHEEIKKVISMLRNLVGDSQEIFMNEPEPQSSPMANIFGEASSSNLAEQPAVSQQPDEAAQEKTEEAPQSTEDLFAELFSEEELKKMEPAKTPEDEEEQEELKPKKKKHDIELY